MQEIIADITDFDGSVKAMNITDFLINLQQKGVRIWIENKTLNIHSPKGVLTPDIKAKIVAHKQEIVVFLRGDRNLPSSFSTVQLAPGLSLQTIKSLIGEVNKESIRNYKQPISDSVFFRDEISTFVLKILIPQIYLTKSPLDLSKFKIGKLDFQKNSYAKKLVTLSNNLAEINLFTLSSNNFVAYAEPPHYIGETEITQKEWENLYPIAEFNTDEVRQNEIGRRYLKTKIQGAYKFKQIPDIWLLTNRSGSNQTNLNIETDILRIGLTHRLLLQSPQGIDTQVIDIQPSYDVYIMLAISLATALYLPDLIKNGAPIVHIQGYPAFEWLKSNEYCLGFHNSSVPCKIYESGIFNFLEIANLANKSIKNLALISLVQSYGGTNFIANDWKYLVERLTVGCTEGQIKLGDKYLASLERQLSDRKIKISKEELIA